jgi:valyl-tRNA synthetase
VNETVAALDAFKFNEAAGTVYQFVWHELCDWYIELAKEALYGEDAGKKRAVQRTLVHALETALRLLHPFMPFITEELWHHLRGRVRADAWPDSIFAARYPRPGPVDEAAERSFGPVIGIVDAIRNIRGEMNVPFKVALEDVEIGALDREAAATVREELGRIHRLANVKDAKVHADGAPIARRAASAVAVGAGFEVRVGLAGAVDLAAESARIDKEIAKVDADLAGIEKKLANPSFVQKAPAEVVEKDRARAEELREKRGKLRAHRAMLSATVDSSAATSGRREQMENQNEQNPNQPAQPASGPATPTSAAMETAEKIASTAMEVGKAAASAVVSGIEGLVEKMTPAKAKPARKPAAKKKKAAAKRKAPKAKKKTAARKAAPRKAAKKTKAKARKPAKRGKRR